MTEKDIIQINYVVGRIEGIASGTSGDIKEALLDTAEILSEMIEEPKIKQQIDISKAVDSFIIGNLKWEKVDE